MKKKNVKDEGFTVAPPARIGSAEIQQKEFRVARMSGYKMRDVDEFLDEITGAMTLLEGENKRMRAGGGEALLGAPDIDEVSRQADEILQRARDEAAAIIREAEMRAAVMGSVSAGTVTEVDKGAITAFLNKERDFLQVLAGHVQQHAEGVKGMAKAARDRQIAPTAAVTPSAPAPSGPAASASPASPAMTQPMQAIVRPEPKEGSPASDPAALTREQAEEPIRVDEPAPASVAASDEDAPGTDEGDRSLRELFWGEE